MEIHGNTWKYMEIHGNIWKYINKYLNSVIQFHLQIVT